MSAAVTAPSSPHPLRRLPAGIVSLASSILVSLVLPAYAFQIVAGWFPTNSIAPLLICSLVPAAWMALGFLRRHSLDVIAVISLSQMALGITISLISGSLTLALIAHALQPALLGAVFAASVLIGRPLIGPLARQTMAGDDPDKQARFDSRASRPEVRRVFTMMSLGWAAGLCLQSTLLILAVRTMTAPHYIWFHTVISYSFYTLMFGGSVRYGRHRSRRSGAQE